MIADELPPPPVIAFHSKEAKATGSLLGGTWDVSQEYDPFRPNEYDKVMKERAEKKEREREAKEKERQLSTLNSRPLVGDYSDDEDDEPKQFARPTGAAIAPPSFLMESSVEKASDIANSAGVSVVAAKIMTRMGYNKGSGLGRDEQGISRALEVEKTSKHGGKIISEHDQFVAPVLPSVPTPSKIDETPETITEIMKNPTKVILLRNMVGPGEVDDDLEPEVKEECSKYGEVSGSVIVELPGDKISPEEAVRIFVEFKRVESAIKAVVDLNGRFFGGRTVKANFFDPDRFKNLDLIDL